MDDFSDNQNKPIPYKLLMIGDIGTGKTNIIKQYTQGLFSTNYKSTIGVDFSSRSIKLDDVNIEAQFWDIAGQERFGNMTRGFYKEALGAFIVFDVTRQSTLNAIERWKLDIDNKILFRNTEDPLPTIILANKIDLIVPNDNDDDDDWNNVVEQLNKLCENNKYVTWIETSAKCNIGIDKAVNTLIKEIINKDKNIIHLQPQPHPPKPDPFILNINKEKNQFDCCT